MQNNPLPSITDFALSSTDKIRFRDTDRQGHVNNAVFSTFLETGRTEIIYDPERDLLKDNCSFVIASLKLDFLNEIHWPGEVQIGTQIARVGRSSFSLAQGIFQNETCVALAETVIVQVSRETKKSMPLKQAALVALKALIKPAP